MNPRPHVSGGTESRRRARMLAGEKLGWIYFIQESGDDYAPVKIGYCTTEAGLKKRLMELQVGNPRRLRVIGTIRGTHEGERQLHQRFRDDRLGGEWFQMTHALSDYLDEIGADEC